METIIFMVWFFILINIFVSNDYLFDIVSFLLSFILMPIFILMFIIQGVIHAKRNRC